MVRRDRWRAMGRHRSRRRLVAAALLSAGLCLQIAPSVASASPGEARTAPSGPPIAKWTLLATLLHDTPRYATATAPKREGTLPRLWHGAPSVLPILTLTNKRLLVRVAQRPNGQRAWIPIQFAHLTKTPYEIVIHLDSTHLSLYKEAKRVLNAPVGVGTDQYPTPKGAFFAAFLAKPPNPGYGPFVLVTSGHSDTITNWQYTGDAMVAIHGPLGADAAIGTNGARVSHGCVRMHLADLAKLRAVPVGSPIYVVS